MQSSRTRTDDQLFETEPPTGLRSLAEVTAAWPAEDYLEIMRELGAETRDQVSYVIHAGRRREGNRIVDFYTLTGSLGEGEAYDVATDARAATQLTHELMQRGAKTITSAAGKKP
jgi:hypothetical protein